MNVVHERCCGLDVHKATVVACRLTPASKDVRTFPTTTRGLLALADWLAEADITAVAMESTGVYWKPVFNVLEATELEVLVVNAQHIKAVPGRKTDVKDSEWIADLLRHGLLKPSFIPDRGHRELRELVRYRKTLTQQRNTLVNRIQKLLEGANVKLGDVVTDVMGKSGRAMLQAMAGGQQDSAQLADLARGSLRGKRARLEEALEGSMGHHQRYLLRHQLQHVEFLDSQIEELSVEIEERMRPFEVALEQVMRLPGIGRRSAEQILAEIGTDMSRFPTHRHLSSWAKLCPGNNESAGKSRSGWTGKGNAYLRAALVEAAWGAARSKDSYFAAQYARLKTRRGTRRAAVAVAHSLLIVIYHLLRDGTLYQDLGAAFLDQRQQETVVRHSVKRLQRLGFQVTLTPNVA